jgi:hypothetical protein
MGDSQLAIDQPLSCNVVHSKSLSLVESSVSITYFLTAQTKGFRVFFAPDLRKTAAATLVQGLASGLAIGALAVIRRRRS